jgi:hypothetical protein
MPLLQFFINENQLTGVEKQELASILTAAYAKSMPEFFVTVVFQEVLSLLFLSDPFLPILFPFPFPSSLSNPTSTSQPHLKASITNPKTTILIEL